MTRRKKDFNKFLEKTSKKYGWSKKLTLEVAQQAFMRYLSDEELLITYDKIFAKKIFFQATHKKCMNEITCPECGCCIHLEWKTPEETKQALSDAKRDK